MSGTESGDIPTPRVCAHGRVRCMKASTLLIAQMHRNPHLMDITQDTAIRHDPRRPVRRSRRRRG
jgi:hypothetical protein